MPAPITPQYMEKLYDDTVDERMQGTALILQLARNPENLEAILFNGREGAAGVPSLCVLAAARKTVIQNVTTFVRLSV